MIFGAMASAAGSLWSMGAGLTEMGRIAGERKRRMRLEQAQRLGTARSVAGASGVEFSSDSIQRHLQTMQTEFTRQADSFDYGAGMAATNMALTTGIQGLSDVGKGIAEQGALENWWRE